MIRFVTGNILESKAEALVNTVNTLGIMGKGIALQFKEAFPYNFKVYREACKNSELTIGKLLIVKDRGLISGEKWIINFPTKTTWRKPSEYEYIDKGLDELIKAIHSYSISSIAIPPLGSGQGGLEWKKVKQMMIDKLRDLDAEILIFEPSENIVEAMKKERVKLTEARALLLFVLYDLVRNGEFVTEFSSEKACYFLQRFGAEKFFQLNFEPNFYGPYSGKVRYILNYLNGSYIMGFSGMDKKPFKPLSLIRDAETSVLAYLSDKPDLKHIAEKTVAFLSGFYSDFSLELLSTIDYLSGKFNITDTIELKDRLNTWSDRKRTLFSDERYLKISITHLRQAGLISG